MDVTHTLAGLIGLYFAAAGIGLLVDRKFFAEAIRELSGQPMLAYLGGILAFAIGGTIVGVHNNWNSLLAGFVSLVGWIALAEGVLLLACRKRFLELFTRVALSPGLITAFGGGTLALGLALLVATFAA